MAQKTPKIDFLNEDEILMCPSGVASKDGVSIKTVMRWIEDGSLPAYKLGGQWRISPRDHRKFRRERWNG